MCRILLVDDSPVFLAAAEAFLAASGRAEVVGRATSGGEALEQSLAVRPDLILMDLSMPGMDGLEAGRRIGAAPHSPPVVIMTIHDQAAYRLAAERSGAAGFLVKSRLGDDLLPLIGRLVPAPDAAADPISPGSSSLAPHLSPAEAASARPDHPPDPARPTTRGRPGGPKPERGSDER